MTTMSADSCERCVVAAAGRRAFLRDIGLAVVGTLALSATPAAVLAESVAELAPAGVVGASRTYEIPKTDSVAVDEPNGVILARWENRVYAFSMKCPHRGSRLEWRAEEQRVFCPKHKARFHADGAHASGRSSRDLDRYEITRQHGLVIVNLDTLWRADRDASAWRSAMVILS
jgi:nitrite reductase/ring-hydroxylating ferredoxin subunit